MKYLILIFILGFTTLISSAQSYQLVWEDNFNAPVLNETQHWQVEVSGDGGGNNEMQFYRRENVAIENISSGENCLVISAKKESYGGKLATSGRLVTRGKVAVKYGKIEARIKLPATANGLWPAFWMLGEDFETVGWPRCGEVDILEMGNIEGISQEKQDRYFNGACHWGENPNFNIKNSIADYSLQNDFHLYTLIWDENFIRMYLDQDKYPNNAPYFEMSIAGTDVPGDVYHYFHKPFNLLLNLAVGGTFTGITGNDNISQITALPTDGSPVKMYIDYIRIYQKGIAGEEFYGPIQIDDNESPTVFTAVKSTITTNSVELLMNATDNSGKVFYEIKFGTSSVFVSGLSGVQKSYIVTGLTPSTLYNFSITAKDANGNASANNPIVFSTTTLSLASITEPQVPAPTPTIQSLNVLSMFSNAYTNVNVNTWKTAWSNVGTMTNIKIGEDDIIKYDKLGHVGVETTGSNLINLTNMNYFHVDIWTPNATKLFIKLVDWGANGKWAGGDDVEHELTFIPTLSTWNSYNLALTDFTGLITKEHFAQLIFKVDPYSSGILYIDNVYFSATSTALSELKTNNSIHFYPNPTKDQLNIASLNEISDVEIRNSIAQLVQIITINATEKTINLSILPKGNYLVTVKLTNGKFSTHKLVKL